MYLTANELKTKFYKRAAAMGPDDVDTYLLRANSFAWGIVGGMPPVVDDMLKAAVALAFEILSKEEGGQIDPVNGNITNVAPSGQFTRNGRQYDPLEVVRDMLKPYADAFDAANTAQAENGVIFL